jgi:hypothetical protein
MTLGIMDSIYKLTQLICWIYSKDVNGKMSLGEWQRDMVGIQQGKMKMVS